MIRIKATYFKIRGIRSLAGYLGEKFRREDRVPIRRVNRLEKWYRNSVIIRGIKSNREKKISGF
jgi:hypothetical protein